MSARRAQPPKKRGKVAKKGAGGKSGPKSGNGRSGTGNGERGNGRGAPAGRGSDSRVVWPPQAREPARLLIEALMRERGLARGFERHVQRAANRARDQGLDVLERGRGLLGVGIFVFDVAILAAIAAQNANSLFTEPRLSLVDSIN